MAKLPFDVGVQSSWRIRRRMVMAILIWCAVLTTYLAILGRPNSLSETTVLGLLALMGSTAGSYLFGAVWDSKITRETAVQQQAVEQGISPNAPSSTTVTVQQAPQGSVE